MENGKARVVNTLLFVRPGLTLFVSSVAALASAVFAIGDIERRLIVFGLGWWGRGSWCRLGRKRSTCRQICRDLGQLGGERLGGSFCGHVFGRLLLYLRR